MKKITISFLLVFALFIAKVNAQVGFGVKAGLNLANMSMKFGGEKVDDINMRLAYHLGAVVDISLTDGLSFQPGLLFSSKGAKSTMTATELVGTTLVSYEVENTLAPFYIEIPMNFVYKLPLGESRFLINAGPYLGMGIAGKTKSEATIGGQTTEDDDSIEWGSDEDESDMKPLDLGINIGVGYQMSNNLFFNVNYGLGFANLVPGGDSDNKMSNNVIGISVGYMLGGGK